MRTILPPAMPSVRTSSVRNIVRWPPIARRLHLRAAGADRRAIGTRPTDLDKDSVAEIFVEQRPRNAGGGPESSVRIGRRSISRTSITPPSLRIIISGAGIAASRTAAAVIRDVRIMRGRIAALSAAVRVRARNPYIPLTSWPLVASMPRSRAYATTASSARTIHTEGLTRRDCLHAGLNQGIDGSTLPRDPARRQMRTLVQSAIAASETAGIESAAARASRNARASRRHRRARRSPSNKAFVACVVECAMKAISRASMRFSESNRSMPATMPAATPFDASCVVGTFTRATNSRVPASIATTSVNVPPTSMPTRSLRIKPRRTLQRARR